MTKTKIYFLGKDNKKIDITNIIQSCIILIEPRNIVASYISFVKDNKENIELFGNKNNIEVKLETKKYIVISTIINNDEICIELSPNELLAKIE